MIVRIFLVHLGEEWYYKYNMILVEIYFFQFVVFKMKRHTMMECHKGKNIFYLTEIVYYLRLHIKRFMWKRVGVRMIDKER